MASWRTLPTDELVKRANAAEEAGEWERSEKMWEEIEARDAQDEANAGGMNGVAPTC